MTAFPKNFLWGASTAAHQVEGKNHNQWTVWELENAKTKAAQAEYQYHDLESWQWVKKQATTPSNYVSDGLADHYHRYREDFDLLEKLNMNAFRFSIEWSRIEPEEGHWDKLQIQHYKDYIDELRDRDIEPIVTLFHFTLPVWFAKRGGFEKRENVKYFVRYAEKIVRELGPRVRYVITINEPEVYASESYYQMHWPPMKHSKRAWLKVINHLALAHKKAAKEIHGLGRRYKVSIAKNSNYFYPGDTAWLSRASAHIMQYFQDDFVIKKFIKSCDFLGVNYYFTNRVYGYRIHNPEKRVSDLGWDLQPADIEFVLERLDRKYKLPLMITENGLADARDEYRSWWLKETLTALASAVKNDVNVIGYLHWSLIDNFEWAHGRWPRFGLASVNYETNQRSLRPSAVQYGKVIKKLRGV